MPSFSDQMYASQFRDLVTRIVRQVIKDERPEPRMGKVYSYNSLSQTAMVLFAGETLESLVKVRCGKNLIPERTMIETFDELGYDAPSDIVRVWGLPGSYFILDYYAGSPVPLTPIGVPMPWLTDTPPEGHVLIQGQDEERAAYPRLFALWGEFFGPGDGEFTFGMPDGQDRVLIGASGTIPVGSTGGSATRILTAANLPPHTHDAGAADQFLGNDTGATTNRENGTGFHAKGVATTGPGPGTSEPVDILPPYLGVNWMVRAV